LGRSGEHLPGPGRRGRQVSESKWSGRARRPYRPAGLATRRVVGCPLYTPTCLRNRLGESNPADPGHRRLSVRPDFLAAVVRRHRREIRSRVGDDRVQIDRLVEREVTVANDVGQLHRPENDGDLVTLSGESGDPTHRPAGREDDLSLAEIAHSRRTGVEVPGHAVASGRADRAVTVLHHDDVRLISHLARPFRSLAILELTRAQLGGVQHHHGGASIEAGGVEEVIMRRRRKP